VGVGCWLLVVGYWWLGAGGASGLLLCLAAVFFQHGGWQVEWFNMLMEA
jgi:hypothetical protein